MGYPKLPTDKQRTEALEALAAAVRRDLSAAAYVRDRAHQYVPSSGIHAALLDVAAELEDGAHLEAHRHGELDDLIGEMMNRRGERRKARERRVQSNTEDTRTK